MVAKKKVNLSVGRGEKRSVKQGAGLTAKGRAKYNRATGSKLKAPVTGKVKIWRANNPDKIRNKNYKDRYGITLDDYNAMLEKQKHRCHLCGSHNNDTKLYVDHCHTKKTVRKLLCQYCNSGLGQFRDNVKVMKKAIEYLKQFK